MKTSLRIFLALATPRRAPAAGHGAAVV